MKNLLRKITIERPVGTAGNSRVNEMLEEKLGELGYEVKALPIKCKVWERGKATLTDGVEDYELKVSPFSEGFSGEGRVYKAGTLDELRAIEVRDGFLVLYGELAKEQLQPKDYPFYYPDEHKEIIELLEEKAPLAIIAVTGQDEMSGLNPFPMFNDGNFKIPSAYTRLEMLEVFEKMVSEGKMVKLGIDSRVIDAESRQLIGTRKVLNSKSKIVLCAHMDTTYDSPGALDNATGVIAMLETARILKMTGYDVDVVPFNGEEHYEANGELAYLGYIQENNDNVVLLVNYDSPFCRGAKTGVSFYNFNDNQLEKAEGLMENRNVVRGMEWYAGDHAAFVFGGTPCMAVSSENLFEGALKSTHTAKDTLETVSLEYLEDTAEYVAECICELVE